ncbi:MAG: hypothetical protein ACRD25_01930, partial [Terracidiphilus sp.]
LHHSDIITYALTRLAGQYARNKDEVVRDLRNYCGGTLPQAKIGQNPSGTPALPTRAIKQTRDQ